MASFLKPQLFGGDSVSAVVTLLDKLLTAQIWKTPAGRDRLNAWYDKFASKLETEVTHLSVPTSIGPTHVLASGPEGGLPLVCLHSMRTGASFLLSELPSLAKRFRLYAPDMPGQSIRGPAVKLPVHDDSYADWLLEVMNELGLPQTNLFGVSWGGFVARLTASKAPERVSKLSIMVPAGIANGSHLTGLAKMAFPMIRHTLWPTSNSLRSLLQPIMTTWDDDWANAIACALKDMKVDPRLPPLARDDELQRLRMPTLVLAGTDDISFPGTAVVDRMRRLVPNLEIELIEDCKHCPPTTEEFRTWLADRLSRFIDR
ncbi:alpha/beta fold hydrolase [Aporhodopirellula aestuarii]|uniref:Alpha/beta hydrolase n=1 Tax=Aporhodopirellula aestuarii TaxID=2950107 RepID=A0ABT0UEE5_9BACT|nr:alpha/beta hydrolase [Aporhodopirellula aestuarii]MCM2375254.1 alpha/beta hydrolase [Aporhodopirellula aestuarii]